MAEETLQANDAEREKLMPITLMALGGYVVIMTLGYFIGNMIYQIP